MLLRYTDTKLILKSVVNPFAITHERYRKKRSSFRSTTKAKICILKCVLETSILMNKNLLFSYQKMNTKIFSSKLTFVKDAWEADERKSMLNRYAHLSKFCHLEFKTAIEWQVSGRKKLRDSCSVLVNNFFDILSRC